MFADQHYELLIAQLMRHEGCRRNSDGMHYAYRCTAGALTIGYGHNLDANPIPGITKSSLLNEEQAKRLLVVDIEQHKKELLTALPWTSGLDSVRQAVLLNMAFNMGIRKLLKFQPTLALIQRGRYAEAADRLLTLPWAEQVKGRAVELTEQLRTGKWKVHS